MEPLPVRIGVFLSILRNSQRLQELENNCRFLKKSAEAP